MESCGYETRLHPTHWIRSSNDYHLPTCLYFYKRLLQSTRLRLVLACTGMHNIHDNVWNPNYKDWPEASIIIPTLGRSESLKRCLESIKVQSFENFEVILVTEKGPLAELRNTGAKRARGRYLIFIDDDTRVTRNWLRELLVSIKSSPSVGGASGTCIITDKDRQSRDLFHYRFFKKLYDLIFLGERRDIPGTITASGAWTTAAADETCVYDGQVDYLEACNMAFRKDAFWEVGGFDEIYKGVGDWSEPDIAFKIRGKGYKLLFNHKAKLYHEPSQDGAFGRRAKESKIRLDNYLTFSQRWIRPCWRHELFKLFIRSYYAFTTVK